MIHISTGKLYDKAEHTAVLEVFDAYMLRVKGDWLTGPTFMEHNQLIYVAEGTLAVTVNKKTITLSAGQAYVVRRHSTFSSCGVRDTDCCFYVVLYNSTLKRYDNMYNTVLETAYRGFYIERMFNDLVSYDKHTRDTKFLLDAALLTILEKLHLLMQLEPQDERIDEVVAYIAHHMDEQLTVDELSAKFHYSGDYMSRLFRRRYGLSIKQYMIEQKIDYAKRLLTTSNIPISSVGIAIGFTDEILFRKFFKYHAHSTPKNYRKLYGDVK